MCCLKCYQPATTVCGRKFPVSTDDFYLPSACGAVLRLAWLGVVVAGLISIEVDADDMCGYDADEGQ